jgi:signal transduction histidine kinase
MDLAVPDSPSAGSAQPSHEGLLRRLAGALAHHVNNGLTGVVGYYELALLHAKPGSEQEHHLRSGLACAHRAAEAVRRIVAFTGCVREKVLQEPICLRTVAERSAQVVRARGLPRMTVVVEGVERAVVRAHFDLLRVGLEHLLQNALEAMPDGGTLTFRVAGDAAEGMLSIADSGAGLPQSVRDHLFEPFWTTKGGNHMGLGLVLCRDIIESLRGRVEIISELGRGTTVTLALPVWGKCEESGILPVPTVIQSVL